MEMTIYKYKKDGKLYMFHVVKKEDGSETLLALPVRHDGKPIVGCDRKDFVLVSID